MKSDEVCVIVCVFGTEFTRLYSAPALHDSYCFTNNPALKSEAEKKGWIYTFIDVPLSDDSIESTFQVKYIKFLQFLKEERFASFYDYNKILMIDHKLQVNSDHVCQLLDMNKNKIMLKCHHRKPSIKIWDEVERLMIWKDFYVFVPLILKYIYHKLSQGYHEYVCLPACCLILYDHKDAMVKKFTDEIYHELMEWKIPRDQIIWAMLSQNYIDIIQFIDFKKDVPIIWAEHEIIECSKSKNKPIIWREPEKKIEVKKDNISLRRFICYFVPWGLLLLWDSLKVKK